MPDLNHGDLYVESPAFASLESIPERFSAAADNESPEIRWTSVPDATRELVLVMHDPDAPLTDGFTHWIVYGIDPASNGLDENVESGVSFGLNTAGETGWMGMAPPSGHGPHHYFFHLYAIDTRLSFDSPPDRDAVLKAIDGHILEQARLMGTFET